MDLTRPHRAWIREWESAANKLQVLIRSADPANHCTVVCGDGTHVRIGYVLPERRDKLPETLTVSVPTPRGSEAAEIMDYGMEFGMCRVGHGLFRRVPEACVIDLIWRFGGVDLQASREANNAEAGLCDDAKGDDLDDVIGDAGCAADDIAVHLGELQAMLMEATNDQT